MKKRLITFVMTAAMIFSIAVNVSANPLAAANYYGGSLQTIYDLIHDIKSDIKCFRQEIKQAVTSIKTEMGNYISWYSIDIYDNTNTTETETEIITEAADEAETYSEAATEATTIAEINTEATAIDNDLTYSDFVYQVYELTNNERVKYGVSKLRLNDSLCRAAEEHAKDMYDNDYFAHNSLDGRTAADRVKKYGDFTSIGENIAMGQGTPEMVVEDWMNSEGHRKNILNEKYTDIGIGYYNGYWVQDFAAVD